MAKVICNHVLFCTNIDCSHAKAHVPNGGRRYKLINDNIVSEAKSTCDKVEYFDNCYWADLPGRVCVPVEET